jgi:Dolichyl-phosphate-mannose-protein mannosyltransferase
VTTESERALLWASAAVALFAVAARLHDVAAYPPMYDWDAGGHALNVVDLLAGRWPDPRSWGGSHPPLFYALSALLVRVLPAAIPIHVTMRLVSSAAWFATVALVWRCLGRLTNRIDAAVVGALLLGIPGLVIASTMMTNDALCALFTTATLVRLLATPSSTLPSARNLALTGVLAGLAAATKATGVAAIGIAAGCYAWRGRRAPSHALRALAILGLASVAVGGLPYIRLFFSLSGSPYQILAARAGSQEKELIADVVDAVGRATTGYPSFPALVYAAFWNDPTAVYLPRGLEARWPVQAVWWGGLLVTAVAAAGAVRLAVERRFVARVAVTLVFGAVFLAALVPHVVDHPYIILTKTNYLLPEALPLGIVLAVGLGAARGAAKTALAAAVLAIATAGIAITVYGWWQVAPGPSGPAFAATGTSPLVAAVGGYFTERAHDPIRALRRFTPEAQLAHGLRLVEILGIPAPPPESGLTADEQRSLELARARVAWLELYNLVRWVQPIAAGFTVQPVDLRERDADADLVVRIAATGTTPPRGGELGRWPFPAFAQRFTLQRDDGAWQIAAVEQTGVVDENAVEAFVAQPTRAGFDRVRALGWHPPWERFVADAVAGR